jgi:predicted dehydrogenase
MRRIQSGRVNSWPAPKRQLDNFHYFGNQLQHWNTMSQKLRAAMIGGGPGSFIGAVHRIAARMDGDYELVAGAFSSKPEKCLETARELGIAQERAYPSWAEMLEGELALPEDQRVQVIMITTPNHVHAAPTIAALEAGFHVILDKPLCTSMEEA